MLSSECHVLSAESTAALHAHYMHACTCTLLMFANASVCICAELTCDLFKLLWIVQALILIRKFDSIIIINCSMCVSFVTCTLMNTMCIEQCRVYDKLVCKCTLQPIAVRYAYTCKQCQVHNGPIPPHASFSYLSIISAAGKP